MSADVLVQYHATEVACSGQIATFQKWGECFCRGVGVAVERGPPHRREKQMTKEKRKVIFFNQSCVLGHDKDTQLLCPMAVFDSVLVG
eukprot:597581-Amphidinium_carterae.1